MVVKVLSVCRRRRRILTDLPSYPVPRLVIKRRRIIKDLKAAKIANWFRWWLQRVDWLFAERRGVPWEQVEHYELEYDWDRPVAETAVKTDNAALAHEAFHNGEYADDFVDRIMSEWSLLDYRAV